MIMLVVVMMQVFVRFPGIDQMMLIMMMMMVVVMMMAAGVC